MSTVLSVLRSAKLSLKAPVEDPEIVKTPAPVSLRTTEERDVDPEPLADVALACTPRPINKDLSIGIAMVAPRIVERFVLQEDLQRLVDRDLFRLEPPECRETRLFTCAREFLRACPRENRLLEPGIALDLRHTDGRG